VTSNVMIFAAADDAGELYTELHRAMTLKAGRRPFGKAIGTTWFRIGFTRIDRSIAMVMIAAWPGHRGGLGLHACDAEAGSQAPYGVHGANLAPATVSGTAAPDQLLTASRAAGRGAEHVRVPVGPLRRRRDDL
jgi:hypothetical protein